MLPNFLQLRYKAQSFNELAHRVSVNISNNINETNEFYDLIYNKRFIPAGNTLLVGIDPIRPNCAILPSINENNFEELSERAKILWNDRIGIGFDLSKSSNPIKILKELSRLNANIELGHRPQRGNMAVLNSSHPMIKEFIEIKSNNKNLYNFNISVGIDNDFNTNLMDLMSQNAWLIILS
jgi:ribonucleotide reductase alpha subunit